MSVQCSGFKMFTNPTDNVVSQSIRNNGVWEPQSTQVVRDNLHSGDVFIDAGAHIGYYTCLAASLGATVFAFEPSINSFPILRENVKENKFTHTYTFPFALWEEHKILGFQDSSGGNTGGSCKITLEDETNKVIAYNLDAIFTPNSVDFIKTDCQGSDYYILKGAKRLITESNHIKILTENEGTIGQQGDARAKLISELGLQFIKRFDADVQEFYVR